MGMLKNIFNLYFLKCVIEYKTIYIDFRGLN
jgi:hypothetical protein